MPIVSGGSGGSAGAVTLLDDQTLGGAAAGITLSVGTGSGKHLMVVASLRTAKAATADNIGLQANGDTGANYYDERATGAGAAAVTSAEDLGATLATIGQAPGASATADHFGGLQIWIPDYRAVKRKVFLATSFDPFGVGTGNLVIGTYYALWGNTATITSVTLLSATAATNLATLSRASLYLVS